MVQEVVQEQACKRCGVAHAPPTSVQELEYAGTTVRSLCPRPTVRHHSSEMTSTLTQPGKATRAAQQGGGSTNSSGA